MTSGAVKQVVYKQVSHMSKSFEEREAYVLDGGVVWRCSGDVERSTSSFRLALHNFAPSFHPHGQVVSHLWLAVPGHDNTLTSTNLGPHKSRGLE